MRGSAKVSRRLLRVMLGRLGLIGLIGSAAACSGVTVVEHVDEPILVIVGHPPHVDAPPPAPPPPPPPPPPAAELTDEGITIREPVEFEHKTATLTEAGAAVLDELANVLRDHPRLEKVSLEVHTDGDGSTASNKKLAKDRGRVIRDYLVAAGIERKRLKTRAFGESKPIADNDSEEGKETNRRLEVTILAQDPAPEPAQAEGGQADAQ